jgi:ABC-type nitrate/sulfonate/bicarbonate transport system permease component
MTRNQFGTRLAAFVFALALLGLWQVLADSNKISPVFFPSPSRSLHALYESFASGRIWQPLGATLQRMVFGWVFASICGIALGAIIGTSRSLRSYLEPMLEFFRPLPASAIIPPAILLLGLGQTMSVSVIAFGGIWPVLLGSIHGFKQVDPRLTEVAGSLEMNRLVFLRKIALPSALPDIFAGLRISLAVSLILAVVVEMQAGQPGLGQNILLAQRTYRSPELYAGIVMLGLIGYLTNLALTFAERHLLAWRNAAL